MSRWQFVLHQQALEEIDQLRPAERRDVSSNAAAIGERSVAKPDGQIRPPNDRVYLVIGSVRVTFWLDAFAREIFVVRIERPGLK